MAFLSFVGWFWAWWDATCLC